MTTYLVTVSEIIDARSPEEATAILENDQPLFETSKGDVEEVTLETTEAEELDSEGYV